MPLSLEANLSRFSEFCFGICTTIYLRSIKSPSSADSSEDTIVPTTFEHSSKVISTVSTTMSSTASNSSSSDSSPSLARSRWGLLQQAIRKKTIPEPVENPGSKRIFERYPELISWKTDVSKSVMHVQVRIPSRKIVNSASNPFSELVGSSPSGVNNRNLDFGCTQLFPIQIHRGNDSIPLDIQNLKGFDKTGRICIWPSEQILSYWSLRNRTLFEGKKILEIGGGFHCLAGLALAKYSGAKQVVLTDGDEVNVEEVSFSIELNQVAADQCHATTLRWGEISGKPEFQSYFDFVIAADVVYEPSIFPSLLETLAFVLKPGGSFILFNPTRDGMLEKFVNMAQKSNAFTDAKLLEMYDGVVHDMSRELIETNQDFNLDWHYPNQVVFKKVANYKVSPSGIPV